MDGKAFGLIVISKEMVNLPKTPKTHFEVFPIQLWADCSFGGTEIEKLKSEFPVKSEIHVIAKAAEIFPNLTDGNIRLENRPDELGSIALNYDENKNRMTSGNATFDYKSFKFDRNDYTESQVFLPEFETRKDLQRLKFSKTQEERNTILNKLLDVPTCCNSLSFQMIFKKYAANESEAVSLNERRLQRELTKEEFNQFKAYNNALSELVKLGYQRTLAEKAPGKALEEGTKVAKQELVERSLQILRENK